MRLLARLVSIAALLAGALSLTACGDDGGGAGRGAVDYGPPARTQTAPATPDPRFDGALWPDPAVATEDATPAQVARSFVEDFVGMPDPAFGTFQQGDARSGEIQMVLVGEDGRPREDSVLATIALRQLDGTRWFVIAATGDDVQIDSPKLLDEIASPVAIAGTGRGFEGNLVVSVRAAFQREPLVEAGAHAGTTKLGPFSAKLAFDRPAATTGAIVVRDGGGLDGVSNAFAAVPVRFAAG